MPAPIGSTENEIPIVTEMARPPAAHPVGERMADRAHEQDRAQRHDGQPDPGAGEVVPAAAASSA